MSYMELDTLVEAEERVAKTLDKLIFQADRDALGLDPRKPEEMHQQLPSEHVASRLRYHAYRLRRAREVLL